MRLDRARGSGPRGAVVAGLMLIVAVPAVAEEVWRAQEPGVGVELVVISPTATPGAVSESILRALLRDVFFEHTDLELKDMSESNLAACGPAVACLAEHAAPTSEYVLLVANVARTNENTIAARLVRLERKPGGPGPDGTPAPITEQAVVATSPEQLVRTSSEAKDAIERMLEVDLRGYLESRGHFAPWGELRLAQTPQGSAVVVDGRTVGVVAAPGAVRVTRLREGDHVVSVEHRRYERFERKVMVTRGATADLAFDASLLPPQWHPLRTATFWAGAGLVVAGVVATAISLTHQDIPFCIAREGESFGPECTGAGFVRGGGLLLAPLGYSLAGAGVSWTLGGWLWGEDDEVPWLPLVLGVGLGVAAYTVSAALE